MRARPTLAAAATVVTMGLVSTGCGAESVPGRPPESAFDPAQIPGHEATRVVGVRSCAELPQMKPTKPASDAGMPRFRLPCLTPGPSVDLSRLASSPVLVNLWASWCGPCREEMPLLQQAAERTRGRIHFVGVNTKDTSAHAASFLRQVDPTYPQLADPDGRLLSHLRIPGLPVTLVLNAEGRVVGKHVGALSEETLKQLLGRVDQVV